MEGLTVGQSQFRQCIGESKNVNNFFLFFSETSKYIYRYKIHRFNSVVFNLLFVVRTDRFKNFVLLFLRYYILCLDFA